MMKALNAITFAGIEIPGWTIETALFWLLLAIVVITVFMVIVFAVLLHRVGKNKTVIVNTPVAAAEPEPEPETVDYTVLLNAPEGLKALQVALYSGSVQVGAAVNVVDGTATIAAPEGDYIVAVFGLPEENYEASVELLSPQKRVAMVTVSYCEPEVAPVEEAPVEEAEEVVMDVQPECIAYTIVVQAPDGLPAIQVALYNGNEQIGSAANVVDGVATIMAEAGDYSVKVFGLSEEEYKVSFELLSAVKQVAVVTITAIEVEVAEEPVAEVVEEPVAEVAEEPAPVAQVEEAATEVVATEDASLLVKENSFQGGKLRYNKSFTARLIQSEDQVKLWYTDLKNELLSYKKVHARISWKRESYNFGRLPFARLSYRGTTLCLFLPLDPEAFVDTKYKVENVSDNVSYVDTPCLYRIKNNRRVKYAAELIAMVAQNLEAVKIEREAEDYYVPYEGLVELIKKGLVKRVVKSAADEAIFNKDKPIEEENDVAEPLEVAPGLFVIAETEGDDSTEE